ncbi:neurofilament medium polypeptide-like isoform X1 [Hibiscus syriacus]|uniref:neurofilament medium polypeptide-like isoform X1 n=1 Tax=Hibiscus syriacus TaxID=106335 RepID=UPI0019250437|nr:neurofilament medium polypeptide-like isoform X1 [Hibiscus syriacus]
MEEPEKINGKNKLSSIPSNYVTLLQLQERWNKEKEQKQKGKEEEAEPQQQEQKETIFEERVDDEVSGRADRKKGRFPRLNRDHGKRVAEGKPNDEIVVAYEDSDTEKKGEELKKKKKNWRKKKRNGMKEKARAANEGEEVKGRAGNALLPTSVEINEREEELIDDETHAPKLASAEEVNVDARREPRPRIIRRTYCPKSEIGRKFRAMSMDCEIITGVHAPKLASVKEENFEARMESQPRINPKTHGRTAEIGRKLMKRGEEINERAEELIGNEAHAPKLESAEEVNVDDARREPLPRITRRTHGPKAEIGRKFQAMSMEGEITTGVHAPKLASVEEEKVEAKMESQPRIIPKTHGHTSEIGRKFQAMSMKGEIRRGYYRRYGRQNVDFNHRRRNPELNRTYYGEFSRRRELNQGNEVMVWVKKGEVKDQNVSGIKISSW